VYAVVKKYHSVHKEEHKGHKDQDTNL